MPDESSNEAPSTSDTAAPSAEPATPQQPRPSAFAPPPSFIQSPPPNSQYVPHHIAQVQHVTPPTPVTESATASWGPGALAGLFIWNLGAVSYWALDKYWLDNSFGNDWWSLFYGGGVVFALVGLILVRPGPAGARFFGLLAGACGCVPLLHEASATSVSGKIFVTNILTSIIVPAVLGLIALAHQPHNR